MLTLLASTIFLLLQSNLSVQSHSMQPLVLELESAVIRILAGSASASSTVVGRATKEGVAACLLIMDDNHYLVEWLAYHFYYLPLRRLIVAVDPKSKTSPERILDRYHSHGLINITLWSDENFLPIETKQKFEKFQTYLYLVRQEHFILECLKTLKQENQTWITYVDTDEFIMPNRDAESVYQFNKSRKVYYILTDPPQNEHWNNLTEESACHSMVRRDMGVKPSSDDEIQRGVPNGFNGSLFLTYRFRWPQPYYTQQRPGKAFLDLSRVPLEDIYPGNTNPHRPLKSHCMPGDAYPGFPSSRRSPFLVYHYAGSFEQFSYRDDGRKSRTWDRYNQRYFNHTSDDVAKFWLPGFVHEVGEQMARYLLEGVGELEPRNFSYD